MGALGAEYRCPVAEIRDASWDDFDAVFELLVDRSRAAFGVSEQKPEFLRQRWELPESSRWVAVDDGRIVGYGTLEEDRAMAVAATDAEVGDALLARVERAGRARGFAQLAATAVPEDAPYWSLLERSGFAQDREILRMWRRLGAEEPEPLWPEDVSLRTYEDSDARAVQTLLDASYSSWDDGYVARSHEGWLTFMTKHDDFDPALWFLVERDDELLACALHWKEEHGRGWVKDIVVREDERGRGLGSSLLRQGFHAYALRGATRVGLKVSTNPTGALRLYDREGFVVDQRLALWHKHL